VSAALRRIFVIAFAEAAWAISGALCFISVAISLDEVPASLNREQDESCKQHLYAGKVNRNNSVPIGQFILCRMLITTGPAPLLFHNQNRNNDAHLFATLRLSLYGKSLPFPFESISRRPRQKI
jgi:hypothetical protein